LLQSENGSDEGCGFWCSNSAGLWNTPTSTRSYTDIKPANLMLKIEPAEGLSFRVVLTDLGLASF
jgi:hypothetical protein